MRRILCTVEYDGTDYAGWQRQSNGLAVQQVLEEALARATGKPVVITGASRTDAGVHAERYVANFRTSSRIPIDRLPFAVNTHTPEDIVVREALEVADDFNAIGSCIQKEYIYKILNSRIPDPFLDKRVCFYPSQLDIDEMRAAAKAFEPARRA